MNVYRDYLKTEQGFWIIEADNIGVIRIDFEKVKPELEINRNVFTDNMLRQLRAYFDGIKIEFDVPLNMEGHTDFQKTVWVELQKIPYGTTISYQQLANRLGNPKLIRAAASANGKNPFPVVIPCHRVIASNGDLTGYSLGLDLKEFLLDLEKVKSIKQMTLF